jgi:Spy/CpxP family protein refolding chaperone
MIGTALGEVSLSAKQRADIEKLAADAEARHASGEKARQDLAEALAVQVEQGTVDRAALQPKIDAVAAAWQAVRPADRAALEQLHAILDAGQRAAFVDALRAQFAAHKGKGGHEGMHAWAKDLNLTDAQKTQIRAAFMAQRQAHQGHDEEHHGDRREAGHHGPKAILEAFKSDTFSMDAVAPKVDVTAATNKMTGRMLGLVETVLPILTAEQRTVAAQKIRAHADTLHGGEL